MIIGEELMFLSLIPLTSIALTWSVRILRFMILEIFRSDSRAITSGWCRGLTFHFLLLSASTNHYCFIADYLNSCQINAAEELWTAQFCYCAANVQFNVLRVLLLKPRKPAINTDRVQCLWKSIVFGTAQNVLWASIWRNIILIICMTFHILSRDHLLTFHRWYFYMIIQIP